MVICDKNTKVWQRHKAKVIGSSPRFLVTLGQLVKS